MSVSKPSNRRDLLVRGGKIALGAAGVSAAASAGLSTPALATGALHWRMATSWPIHSAGPGISADRLAQRITRASDGRLTITVHGAGALVPALETFDAVAGGVVQMAHTAAIYRSGKMPAAAFFTTVPFGLTPREHAAWILHGGGQDLWDRLYAPFGVKPFMAGNTGTHMAGWFKRPIASLADIKGMKLRIVGLGGEIMRRLGATPVTLPAGEIFAALQSGLVDGAEFLGPWIDEAFGFYKAANTYAWPGLNKPNGVGECLVAQKDFAALPGDLQHLISSCCLEEQARALAEADWRNAAALARLDQTHGVRITPLPTDVIAAARDLAGPVIAEAVSGDALGREILASYEDAGRRAARWARVGVGAYDEARAS